MFLKLRPSSRVAFKSNIMQAKLIQEIKFVGKATQETVCGIKFLQTFYPYGADGQRRRSSDESNLMHKFENTLVFLNLESS